MSQKFFSLNENKDLQKALQLILYKSIEEKRHYILQKLTVYYGNNYFNQGENDSAYYYFLKSENCYKTQR
ncbi:MAG: hypothetical protein IPO23_10750 [Flavobacterium sp.]|nr:hypothetical protein [Flavobacterium sp.]